MVTAIASGVLSISVEDGVRVVCSLRPTRSQTAETVRGNSHSDDEARKALAKGLRRARWGGKNNDSEVVGLPIDGDAAGPPRSLKKSKSKSSKGGGREQQQPEALLEKQPSSKRRSRRHRRSRRCSPGTAVAAAASAAAAGEQWLEWKPRQQPHRRGRRHCSAAAGRLAPASR